MADAYAAIRQGESRPLFGAVTTASGTVTVQGTPTATLYDATGAVVSGYDGIDCTGWDSAAAATVRAWLVLASAGLDPGTYTLVFSIVVLGSDALARTELASVLIDVQAATLGVAPATSSYASLDDVQNRVPRDLWRYADSDPQPSSGQVNDWLVGHTAKIDASLAWKYVVPVTDAADLQLVQQACALLAAADVWEVRASYDTEGRQAGAVASMRRQAWCLLAYDPKTGKSSIVLSGTALSVSGEAETLLPETTLPDFDDCLNPPQFSMHDAF